MVSLVDLWFPVLMSGALVFVVSSIIHMALPIHKGDYKKLAGEEGVLEAMRESGVQPGQYMFPCPGSMNDMGTPEMIAKYEQGPVGFLSVIPSGVPAIGKSLIQWFVYSLVIGVFVAYVGTMSMKPGAEYMDVFRMTSTVAILGYGVSSVPDSIWKGVSWTITLKFVFDGVVYGLMTAGAFAWLWPDAIR